MTKEMLINTVEGQECRIAIVTDGQLDELYIERVSSASHVGNIYKGRITNVEPSIQAAFVDFGLVKNGFLHISDVNPSYFPRKNRGGESVGRKKGHRDRPPIQECLRRGQEVIVQLTKEGIGTKGPTMTTYLSIPGRLLVMMPGMSRLGVSRKIEDDEARDKARAILADLKPPQDIGFIVRTAAIERPKREFQRDLNYLLRLWKSVKHRIQTSKAPAEIYQESDLVTRTIRDVYNTDIQRIICDSQEVAVKAREFLDVALPRTKNVIDLYTGKEGLFHEYGLEQEIERIYARRLELPSGGSLVFDQAEALVAIDVNSGRFREHSDAETTATKMNIEAAKQIARQLRLRDLGGVVIIDFIDMREERNRRAVEKALRDEIRNDRAKTKVQRISIFGIVEMTRQRVRPSLKQGIFRTCNHCEGTGLIKNEESQSLLVMRNLQRACSNEHVFQVEVSVTPSVEHHLANFERRRISELEAQFGKKVLIKADPSLAGSELKVTCLNSRGSVVAWEQPVKATQAAVAISTINLDQVVPPKPVEEYPEDEFYEVEEEPQEEPQEAVEIPTVEKPIPEIPLKLDRIAQPPKAEQAPAKPAATTSRPAAPASAPASAPAAPQGQPPQATQPVAAAPGQAQAGQPGQPGAAGQKRRRGRRGGRKHRARRERQALAAQQAALAAAAAGVPGQAIVPPPEGEQVPAYDRNGIPAPSEEEELSEAREQAIEQQAQEETAPVPTPQAPAEPVTPPPPQPQETTAPTPETVEPAASAPEEDTGKKRRTRRGGKGRRKKAQPETQDQEQAAAKAPSPEVAAPAPAAPSPATKTPAPRPVPAVPVPVTRKGRTKARKPIHRQDKEYYEEGYRRQKEQVRKPKDALPDEEDVDFTTEV